jgi:pimeloyl-ACP methyl ester carboxylesterase
MIKYEVRGSGSPVVLVHSGGMSGRQWRRLAERLSPSHRVLVPDLLGYGANPPWPDGAPFHFRDDVRAVVELLDSTDGPAHVVGHSYGGLIACFAALERPLRSLVVFDPPAFGVLREPDDDAGLRELARVADNPLFLDDERGGTREWLELFVDYWTGHGAWRAMEAPSQDAFARVGRKVFWEVRSLLLDRTSAETYAALRFPALLMTSKATPIAARRVVEILHGAIAGSTLIELEGVGHMAPVTHADLVNGHIAGFIEAAERQGRVQG